MQSGPTIMKTSQCFLIILKCVQNCWQIQEFPKGSKSNISNMFTYLLRELTLDFIWWDKNHLEDKYLAFLEMFNWGGKMHSSEHVQHQPMGGVSEWAEIWKGVRSQAPSLSASWLWIQPDQSPRVLLQTRSWHNELYLQARSQNKCFLP